MIITNFPLKIIERHFIMISSKELIKEGKNGEKNICKNQVWRLIKFKKFRKKRIKKNKNKNNKLKSLLKKISQFHIKHLKNKGKNKNHKK